MSVLRYRPCQPPRAPRRPRAAGALRSLRGARARTHRRSARGGPPPTWPPTWWCASATPPRRRASSSAGRFASRTERFMERAKAARLPRAGRPRAQRSTARPVRGARAAHADQPPGVRGPPRGRAPRQRPRAAHRPSRPRRRALGQPPRAGARFMLRKVRRRHGRLQRPGADGDHRPATAPRSWSPASRSTCCSTSSAARAPPRWRSPATPGGPQAVLAPTATPERHLARRRRGRGCGGRRGPPTATANEHVGGALEPGVAVVDPVLGARPRAGRRRLRRPGGPSACRPTRRRCARCALAARPGSQGAGATQPPP